MTCTYDGKMVVTKAEIEPCCGALHRAIIAGVVYRGDMTVKSSPKKLPCAKLRLDGSRGLVMFNCPFCGAQAMIREESP